MLWWFTLIAIVWCVFDLLSYVLGFVINYILTLIRGIDDTLDLLSFIILILLFT